MFTVTDLSYGKGILELRRESLTGLACKISPERRARGLDTAYIPEWFAEKCPFCGKNLFSETPVFENGGRICVGESVTFPNKYPFSERHTVTVVTRDHFVENFSRSQVTDALEGQGISLYGSGGYPSINWNYLPSAGASIAHPHLQGLADRRPSFLAGRYLHEGPRYREKNGRSYWDDLMLHEKNSERYLFGNEICWMAHAVPLGEREVRCVLPVATLEEFEPYRELFAEGLLRVLKLYRQLGTYAFNMSLFFDSKKNDNDFRAFCSVISRINPNATSMSDSAFMERIHLEPVILTLPEELGRVGRGEFQDI
jgi:UDPglucose--hexose-1-phosphate uridylyltransferase